MAGAEAVDGVRWHNVSIAKMGRLPAVFEMGGIVTAGNASPGVDGGAAMVLGKQADAVKAGLTPLVRVVGIGTAACDPKILGWGPVPAAETALAMAGVKGSEIDPVELNEAFAPQAIAVVRDWKESWGSTPRP